MLVMPSKSVRSHTSNILIPLLLPLLKQFWKLPFMSVLNCAVGAATLYTFSYSLCLDALPKPMHSSKRLFGVGWI